MEAACNKNTYSKIPNPMATAPQEIMSYLVQ